MLHVHQKGLTDCEHLLCEFRTVKCTTSFVVRTQAAKLRRTMTEAGNKKQSNRIAHSAPGSVKIKSARKKKVVAEME